MLKVNEASVRGWIKDGQLRAIAIGKGWRIADSDLDAFLCSHSTRVKDTAVQVDGAQEDGAQEDGAQEDGAQEDDASQGGPCERDIKT